MKRLSVPILMLALACHAMAGYYISVNGQFPPPEINLLPSDTLNIGIVVEPGAGTPPLPACILTVQGPGAIEAHGCSCEWLELCVGHDWCYWDLCEGPLPGICDDLGIDDGLWIEFIGLAPLAGLVVTDLTYHGEAQGDVTLSLLNADEGTLLDSVTIHQVADPPPLKLPDLFTHTVSDRFKPATGR